jgi:hypothetical protein
VLEPVGGLVVGERQPLIGVVAAGFTVGLKGEVASVRAPVAVTSIVAISSSATSAPSRVLVGRRCSTLAATARLIRRGIAVASSAIGRSGGSSPAGKSPAPRR